MHTVPVVEDLVKCIALSIVNHLHIAQVAHFAIRRKSCRPKMISLNPKKGSTVCLMVITQTCRSGLLPTKTLPLENFNTQNCKNITMYITYIACILQKYT